jgi:hypothetical protein
MKVRTDLQAGSIFDNLPQEAQQTFQMVSGFLSTASQNLTGAARDAVEKAESLWGCLTGA